MIKDFELTSNMVNDVLVMKTEGYINNAGGEKISQEFDKHYSNGITKVLIDIEKSNVVNSIGISFLIEYFSSFSILKID